MSVSGEVIRMDAGYDCGTLNGQLKMWMQHAVSPSGEPRRNGTVSLSGDCCLNQSRKEMYESALENVTNVRS